MSLKRTETARKRPLSGVRWDERNLEENERIKASLVTTKINEPKTPYHGPLGEEAMDDDHHGMQPLELDEDGPSTSHASTATANGGPAAAAAAAAVDSAATATAAPVVAAPAPVAADDGDTGAGGSDAPMELDGANGMELNGGMHEHEHEHEHHQPLDGAALSEGRYSASSGLGYHEWNDRSGFSSDSEHRHSLSGQGGGELKKQFQQHRKAHYNMREALRRARQLLSEDGEGGGDADGPERLSVERDGEGSGGGLAGPSSADFGAFGSQQQLEHLAQLAQLALPGGGGGAGSAAASSGTGRQQPGGAPPGQG